MSNKLKYALRLAELGFSILPCKPNSKNPKNGFNWGVGATRNSDVIRQWFDDDPSMNYGACPKDTGVIVDLDVKPQHGIDGRKTWQAALFEHGAEDPDTLTVTSPSGGLHLYFKTDSEVGNTHNFPKGSGVDVRGVAGYVIGPGCTLPYGSYKLTGKNPIADAPAWLMANYLRQPGPKSAERDWLVEPDSPENIGQATVFLKHLDPAIEGDGGNAHTYAAACWLSDLGISEGKALGLMISSGWNDKCEPPWTPAELEVCIRNAYRYQQNQPGSKAVSLLEQFMASEDEPECEDSSATGDAHCSIIPFKRTEKGKLMHQSFENALLAVRALELQPAYDTFNGRVMLRKSGRVIPFDDRAGRIIRETILTRYKLEVSKDNVHEAVHTAALDYPYHPVRDLFDALNWDGANRLDTWLTDYFGVEDTPYTRAVGRKWLLAAVTRIYRPGAKFDSVLVLVGLQGINKSRALNLLALNDDWFTDNPPASVQPDNKDAVLVMHGKLIVEFPEFHTFVKGSRRDEMKAYVSRRVDRLRRPYGREVEDLPRQCVFVGSTNETGFLEDPTGARRYWPVKIPRGHVIDLESLRSNRNQLWAEAVAAFRAGETCELDPELWEAAAEMQEAHHNLDPWEGKLKLYLSGEHGVYDGDQPEGPLTRVHSGALMHHALKLSDIQQTPAVGKRIRAIMESRLGWQHKATIRISSTVGPGYFLPGAPGNEYLDFLTP